MKNEINRRRFLRNAAWTGVALGTLGSRVLGANDTLRVAVMGTNGRGSSLARSFSGRPGAKVVAVCDVDARAVEKGRKAVETVTKEQPDGSGDVRSLLERKDIDILVVATPNHWHAPATIMACKAGKHVYVEKPCSHNAREGELMVEAARKHERVVQMGNQRRSRQVAMDAIDLVKGGALGRVYFSRSWYANARGPTGSLEAATVPDWLDFDLWQGPAPRRPYTSNIVHYKWHWFWHWGSGELGNNGVHAIDLSRWGLGVDYPIRVTSGGGRYHFKDDQDTPDTHLVTFDFEDGKCITWQGMSCNRYSPHGSGFGVTFQGEKGSLVFKDSGYTVYDASGKEVETKAGGGGDAEHIQNFLDCIRNGGRPNAEIEGGHKSTLLCHLGNIAQRTGHTLHCDPRNGRVQDDPAAAKLWGRDYEAGWEPSI